MPNKKKIEIPLKNYYLAGLITIAVIILTLYIFKIYEIKQTQKYQESYLIKNQIVNLKINDLNEISQVFSEAPANYYALITYTGDKENYNLEKNLEKTITKYDLKDIFYYIDITKSKDDENLLEKLNTNLKITTDKINSIPIIIYFNNNKYEIIDVKKLENFIESNKEK